MLTDLSNLVVGYVTVGTAHCRIKGNTHWLCTCICGKVWFVAAVSLKRKFTRSCGCRRGEKGTTHGQTNSPEYTAWKNMRARCNRKTNKAYKYYGGRGITVCNRWQNSFENFLSDMGPRPNPKLTLERKNNNLGYAPENCIWDTRKNQAFNRRGAVVLTAQGRSMTATAWAEELGIDRGLIYGRLKSGWSHEKALFHPFGKR